MAAEKRKLYEEPTSVHASLTAMIDVVFLLIIFFLFGQFRKLEGEFLARLPEHPGIIAAPEKIERLTPGQVLIRLESREDNIVYKVDNRVYFDRTIMEKALADSIKDRKGEEDSPIYIIDFDDAIPVGETINIYDFLLSLGVKDVSFASPSQ